MEDIKREIKMRDDRKLIEKKKDNFKDHVLTILHESDEVKRYQFRQPDTGCFGFNLTCADNLIVMNGDTYSLFIEPGYGRCGLAFLRGSVNSYDYFLSKCPYRDEIKKYDYDKAMENLTEEIANEYLTEHQLYDAYGLDEGEQRGEVAYYDLCYQDDNNIDEPCSPRIYTNTTLNQIAGLQCFVEAYNKLMEK